MSSSRGVTWPSASRTSSASASATAAFEDVQGGTRIAPGQRHEMLGRGLGERDARPRTEGSGEPALRSASARRTTVATSSSVSASRRQTRIRDMSAELTSK